MRKKWRRNLYIFEKCGDLNKNSRTIMKSLKTCSFVCLFSPLSSKILLQLRCNWISKFNSFTCIKYSTSFLDSPSAVEIRSRTVFLSFHHRKSFESSRGGAVRKKNRWNWIYVTRMCAGGRESSRNQLVAVRYFFIFKIIFFSSFSVEIYRRKIDFPPFFICNFLSRS